MSKKNKLDDNRPLVDMKTHILTVASSVILKKGLKNTSLKNIAKEAGISKGTLYYYYSAKEDIIYDIAKRNMIQITDEVIKWIEHKGNSENPEAILKAFFEKGLEAEDKGRLHLYLLNDAVTSNEKLAEKFKQLYAQWRILLKDTLDQLLPEKKSDNLGLSYLILTTLDGLMLQKMCGTEMFPLENIVKVLLK